MSVVTNSCLKQSSCTVFAQNGVFTDPCSGTVKALAVEAHCSLCGNGVVDSGEVCDDGYNDGLFCNNTCSTRPVVGNIRVDCDGTSTITESIRSSDCINLTTPDPSWLSLVSGVHATVYEGADCTGNTKVLASTETNFCAFSYDQGGNGLNDNVRSIRVERN
jgi:hypothetical protein